MVPMLSMKSGVPGVSWPGIAGPRAANLLALQFQLERTQHWPADVLQAHQLAQLKTLLDFCRRTVPFYRDRLGPPDGASDGALTMERWRRLPLLTRRNVQEAGRRLYSTEPPKVHGGIGTVRTSGSTGTPVEAARTELAQFYRMAVVLRSVLWHDLDVAADVAVLRRDRDPAADPKDGRSLPDWGPPYALAFVTGSRALLDVRVPIGDQVAWLLRRKPGYLITLPSNLALIARHCLDHAIRLPELRLVRTLSEVVTDDLRALCQQALGVPIADVYSTEEVGPIAVQCPLHTHYHVQSEAVLVEVLDEQGAPCGPGQAGRVVVTPLHNFAMPLLRYDIGDYAEVGPPCDCGRTLPVLTRILGRDRNRLVMPNGERTYAPVSSRIGEVAAIIQHQMVQTRIDQLELRIVARRQLTDDETGFLRDVILHNIGHPFPLDIVYVDAIPRTESGKFEDFRCEVP
jgi:phenylacetate-CoA ligase